MDRDALVVENLDLVRAVASRWRNVPEHDELVQEGMIGLVDASRRWQPGRSSFRTYARYRIRGAIVDAIRARFGRHLTGEEFGRRSQTRSLHDWLRGTDDLTLMDGLVDDEAEDEFQSVVDREEAFDLWAEISPTLPERERFVLWLRHAQGMTLQAVGEVLGVTEGRVSQLEQKALMRARAAA